MRQKQVFAGRNPTLSKTRAYRCKPAMNSGRGEEVLCSAQKSVFLTAYLSVLNVKVSFYLRTARSKLYITFTTDQQVLGNAGDILHWRSLSLQILRRWVPSSPACFTLTLMLQKEEMKQQVARSDHCGY